METIEKLIKVKDEVLINISQDVFIKFVRIFQFPPSSDVDSYLGHIKIWNDYAPFYFIYNDNDLYQDIIPGYKRQWFIKNQFVKRYDKNNRVYLRCSNNPDYKLVYHTIKTLDDKLRIDKLIYDGKTIFTGYEESSYHGEAFEIVKI